MSVETEKGWIEIIVDLASTCLIKKSTVSCHDIHAELRAIDKVFGVSESDYSTVYSILLSNFNV